MVVSLQPRLQVFSQDHCSRNHSRFSEEQPWNMWLTRVVLTPPFQFMKTILSLMTRTDRPGHFIQVPLDPSVYPFFQFQGPSFVKLYLSRAVLYKGWWAVPQEEGKWCLRTTRHCLSSPLTSHHPHPGSGRAEPEWAEEQPGGSGNIGGWDVQPVGRGAVGALG